MSDPIVRGSNSVHRHHTTGRVSVAETVSRAIVLQGPYDALEAMVPPRKSRFEGLRVSTAELVREKGGMGKLTVTGTRPKKGGGGSAQDADGNELVYEVEMAQLEKPIMSNPKYAGYAEQIELWRNAEPAMRVQYKYFDQDNQEAQLDGNALKAAQLILKGVESYLVFAPVCRRTTRSEDSAEDAFGKIGGNCGKKGRPPAVLLALTDGDWEWLKTADRAVETSGGGSERVEEWTGADEWSDDLYESVGAGG